MTNTKNMAMSSLETAEACNDQERFNRWKKRLEAFTELQLPTDYPRPLPLQVVEDEQFWPVDDSLCLKLLQLSLTLNTEGTADGHCTPFTLVLAAYAVLLHRFTGEEDIVVGTLSPSGNPLVLRLPVRPNQSFQELVQTIRKVEEEALDDEVPYEELIQHLNSDQQNAHQGSTQHNNTASLMKLRFINLVDMSEEAMRRLTTSNASEMTVFISQTPTARRLMPIEIKIAYNSVLFTRDRIDEILAQLRCIFNTVTASPQIKLEELSLVSDRAEQLSVLPNPAEQLGKWEDWPGAIHRIFIKNARQHPERLCVTEAIDKMESNGTISQSERHFSYEKIARGALTVAKTLINKGLKRGDVCVIYAYRGVELVIAIVGVLMAGCTFSVIDPQYPPPRQQIYLSVAQPKGLIVLERAGQLHEDVQKYISDELPDLKFVLPDLKLHENGNVEALKSGSDVLIHLTPEESKKLDDSFLPEIFPDSIGTLSFTSGSTGIPKGVRGRHFSLTNFYPWMSQEFGLSENDTFTMLSGIAHDPIQRDIFTPLFFGAKVCIPTAEQIATPGYLAQWVQQHNCTITHLTPAMGQLLSSCSMDTSGDAEDIKLPLRHAFFVGDILTKRDVRRLQSLAPKCTIINMYGTTETQRAVSYYPIFPEHSTKSSIAHEKDVMPAGRGMRGVHLLVINAKGNRCGVGELGEIYVRSMGLAEGYLRNDDETKKKFMQNFLSSSDNQFDRLYKTGDLGRYRPDGNVECAGRRDDQIKIRGFRIELGEIDLHLSQVPFVRENVTLVRRDAYEEKVLISYFVPNWKMLEEVDEHGNTKRMEMNSVVAQIRSFLKQKLASYSIPSIFVPLHRMPLTPNGKVDKNALPFPDTALVQEQRPATAQDMTPREQRLVDIWSETLFPKGQRKISLDDNFFDNGGHSILATRLIFQIRKQFNVDLPLNVLFKCPTVRMMAKELDIALGLYVAESAQVMPTTPIESAQPSKLTMTACATEESPKEEENTDLSEELNLLTDDIKPNAGQIMAFDLEALKGPDGQFIPKSSFLTGATGFLGAFILHSLLKQFPNSHVFTLVRAKTLEDGWNRLEANMIAHALWSTNDRKEMQKRVSIVLGDLAQPYLGIPENEFLALAEKIDCVVHNGALVHWVYPYSKLKAANVQGTLEALKLSYITKVLKPFHFVSSTSVLDTEVYTEQKQIVHEDDDLEGSRTGLKSGYGQSKWVAEKLLLMARERTVVTKDGRTLQLPITIIRPGYIVGDSKSGVTNTDDFLWRLCKGCLQLGQVPVMNNVVNACPVDYVAQIVTRAILKGSEAIERGVFHVWNPQCVRFSDLFEALITFGTVSSDDDKIVMADGWELQRVAYLPWREALMELTLKQDDHALYPLLHFVLDDLPTSTKAAALDWRNTRWLLEAGGYKCPALVLRRVRSPSKSGKHPISKNNSRTNVSFSDYENDDSSSTLAPLMELYLNYLCQVEFLPWPAHRKPSNFQTGSSKKIISRSGH